MGTREHATALLERDADVGRIVRLLDAASEGRGGILYVEGPAGIGKTSLLDAGREAAAARGLAGHHARGGELEREFAFGVVRQLLEHRIAELQPPDREALFEGAAALARPVLDPAAGGAAGESAAAVVHGLYWVCASLAETAPRAFVIDDAHWADLASLRLLAYLANRIEGMPLAIVVAARPPTAPAQAELIAALAADATVERLEPAPLGEDAVATIVRATIEDADDELCRACHTATAGNPFLATTLAAALADERHRRSGLQPDRIADLAGRAVSRLVVDRLGRLPAAAQTLARAVAILGTDADLGHAARLADLAPEDAARAADALAAQSILRVGRPLEFVHPLVRAAVRDEMPAAERALSHARAARLLTEYGASAGRVAVHLLETAPIGDRWTVDTLRAAAAQSLVQGAPEAAATYLRRARDEPPRREERAALLRELGAAEMRAAQPDPATAHLNEALELAEAPAARAAIAHDLAINLVAPGRYEEATAMLERAADEAAGGDPDLALGIEAELLIAATMVAATYPLVERRLDDAAPDPAGATPGERAMICALTFERVLRGEDAESVARLTRVAIDGGIVEEHGGDSGLAINVVFCAIAASDFDTARDVSDAALRNVSAHGSIVGFARQSCFRSMLHYRCGELAEAEAAASAAIDAGLQGGYRVALMAHAMLVDALVARGRLGEADAALTMRGLDGPIPETFMLNFVLHSRAWLRLAQGRVDGAVRDFEELARREAGWRPWNPAMFTYRSGLALALNRQAAGARAIALATDELERARRWGTPQAIGPALRTLGQVSGGEEGLALLRESVGVLAPSPARLEHARSLVALGAAIRRAGLRAEARETLHTGMELAHRCGADALVAEAREELRATGARPRRIMRTGTDALTPSELRVARMAAEGMANREIAQALFVTLRTVEVHLTHAYQKLDISSRDQLPARLAADD